MAIDITVPELGESVLEATVSRWLKKEGARTSPSVSEPRVSAGIVWGCAVGYVEGARLAQRTGAIPALCWAMIVLAPLALVGLVVSIASRSFDQPAAGAWVALLYAGVISMFLGSIAWYRGLAAGGIARIGQLNLMQPLLAIGWSALILKEHITPAVPLTALAVLAAMAVCLRSRDASTSPGARRDTDRQS